MLKELIQNLSIIIFINTKLNRLMLKREKVEY